MSGALSVLLIAAMAALGVGAMACASARGGTSRRSWLVGNAGYAVLVTTGAVMASVVALR